MHTGEQPQYEADICLILEGTYPYVPGGVSSWVHSLINGLNEFTYSIVLLLPDKQERKPKYPIPANVTGIHEVYLQDPSLFEKPLMKQPPSHEALSSSWNFHMNMPFVVDSDNPTLGKDEFEQMVAQFHKKEWNIPSVFHSKAVWNSIVQLNHIRNPEASFLDYYWTWKYLHAGILTTIAAEVPLCRMYHTVSTGYAGLLAARAGILTGRPMIVTEHGIYSKERKIEISRASWIFEKSKNRFNAEQEMDTFKQIWIDSFRVMSRMCYDQAEQIITLFTGNQRLQMDDGAPVEKLKVIPNGVEYSTMSQLTPDPQTPPVIGFVGRVVPIKDVKTFLRAIALVVRVIPEIQVWIMGPTEEDKKYYEECVQLAKSLKIDHLLTYTGNVDLKRYYPKLSVMVLTSLSEGQPLVILEAQCLGIPCVASDVGACRELLEGRDEDKSLGPGGIITGLASPDSTASAIVSILQKPSLAKRLGEAGKQRMKEYYDMPIFYNHYRKIYLSTTNS
ncbi:MAG: GT4 family glycosyltransferase PelF [SAR324 cluster bacterium]|nr:GT4 family glycosyltransferase PelF [SAR324 cluster bacterium]